MTDLEKMAREVAESVHTEMCGQSDAHSDWIEAHVNAIATALRSVRNAALEEAARWHDGRAADWRKNAMNGWNPYSPEESEARAGQHEYHAKSIRALQSKEPSND